MKPQLSGSHRRAYDGIFRHPAARNLGWRNVRSLLVIQVVLLVLNVIRFGF